MQICTRAGVVRTSQVNVLAYNTGGAASHWLRNRAPGGVPSVRNRVVLPSLARFIKVDVEPTDDVDFAVVGIVGQVRISPDIRHWSASAAGVSCDIVDLRRILDDGAVKAAEYVNRVGVAGIDRSRQIYGDWNIRQARPSVSNRIVAVKSAYRVCRVSCGIARSGIGVGGIAGHCRRFNEKRDRKSTRLNSSHSQISYAVFCF